MSEAIKNKIRQLYLFLKEANQLRFRPVRQLQDQPKCIRLADMPDHPSMQIYRPVRVENVLEVPEILLKVKRPPITRCPIPPKTIVEWLLPGWDDPSKLAKYSESRNETDSEGKTITVGFNNNDQRISDFEEWESKRDAWRPPELSARNALRFFEAFYDIHSTIEKDSEQFELLLADGHLLWQAMSTLDGSITISHPILFKRVELLFDPSIPEFTIHETDRESEIYGSLFVDLENISPSAIRNRRTELELAGYHPMGWEDTDAFLKAFIQTLSPMGGEFLKAPITDATADPRMWRDPVLVLRKRISGIANAVDAIIDDIEKQVVFPPALAQITGSLDEWRESGLYQGTDSVHIGSTEKSHHINDDDILLAKEANEEQLQIIRRLHNSGSVIVQGPPGTGKTHTIGNIIGHLLAQGKSILVTAQTAKALRVLRNKVPSLLQPLCVSVLGSDQDARRQLESSINSITERLTSDSAESLLVKGTKYEGERKTLLHEVKILSHKLREALENEYKEIVISDKRYSPSDAARFVAKNKNANAWIPSPVKLGNTVSLTEAELRRIYVLGSSYTTAEEIDVGYPLPDLSTLPTERQFEVMVSEYQNLLTNDLTLGADLWEGGSGNSAGIETLAKSIEIEFTDDLRRQSWRPHAIIAGIHGGSEREVWEQLIATVEKAVEANSKHALIVHHRPRLSETIPFKVQQKIAHEICDYLDRGGKIGFLQLATRSEWRQFTKSVSVAAGKPNHREHFEALEFLAKLEAYRYELETLWDNLIGHQNNKKFNKLGTSPELSCRALIPEIKRCLDWYAAVWVPLSGRINAEGFNLNRILSSIPNEASLAAEYTQIERLAIDVLPPMLAAEAGRRKLRECELGFDQLANLSMRVDPTSPGLGCIGSINTAVRSRDTESYTAALNYIRRLYAVKPLVLERAALIEKLKMSAIGWADWIASRTPPHDKDDIPGDVNIAWTWRQLHDTLVERDRLDAYEIQCEIDKRRDVLREITQSLIDAKAWGQQLGKLQSNHSVRQALVGWLDTAKRLISTRQLERRNTLLSEGRKLMRKCVGAVPVWIMPISMVAENFDPRTTRFDIVIIDEASQADLNALIPLYMGKQIIVVGDHEQVTPLGVGKEQTYLDNLRKSILHDIPNSHLFDNQSSIYDIGRQSFGDAIRLVEHFRCVPEIIAFCNILSYHDNPVKPLRESNSTHIRPACVPRRVLGVREGDINEIEAQEIIALIKAMIKHPAYDAKSIGIISMLKENQAILIQSMLHKEIESVEIEKRRIQAGISAEFQGDERDIVFLSMVDSSANEGPLRAIGEGAFELNKKRYNVAVSRARDQIWVVHSFDLDLHLKSTDLRYKLLQHMKDPLASLRLFDQESGRTESPFEKEVLKRLTDAGFCVKSQWQVGYYRIDLVVEGGGKRLAIECDGDRYHPMEKLSEDMERQSILERLGWKFVRIRGSAYYRNPESAMRPVFERLKELEITPQAHKYESSPTNMTLVHELDTLIAGDIENDQIVEEESTSIAESNRPSGRSDL